MKRTKIRCEYCGYLFNMPFDGRSMAQNVVEHGREILEFMVLENVKSIDICNFCYAHLSIFKKEQPFLYEKLCRQIN